LRIFPLYYGTVLLCLVLLPLVPLAALDWLRDLSGQQVWFWAHVSNYYKITQPHGPSIGWLSTLWSLAVEEHFYLVWPFLVLWLSPRRLGLVCAAGAVAVLGVRIGLAANGTSGDYLYRSTLTRIDPLLLGALVAILGDQMGTLRRLVPAARTVLAVALGAI